MSIIIDQYKKVIIQGITGREGRARTKLMREYGTNVVAGCTPGKGGQDVEGIAVYDKVSEAVESSGGEIDISVVFVPARLVKVAAIEAIKAGIKLIVLVPDRVPLWDAMEIAAVAKSHDAHFIGPNTLGIISRSGGMTSSCGYYLSQAGIALSTLVHVGGDSVIGLPIPEIALMFENDSETEAIVIFGEIGGSQEERLAELMSSGAVTKPIVAYIGGKAAKEGTRFSHAGAIIEGNRGTHAGKVAALRNAGATVVQDFGDLPLATVEVLARLAKAGETALS